MQFTGHHHDRVQAPHIFVPFVQIQVLQRSMILIRPQPVKFAVDAAAAAHQHRIGTEVVEDCAIQPGTNVAGGCIGVATIRALRGHERSIDK